MVCSTAPTYAERVEDGIRRARSIQAIERLWESTNGVCHRPDYHYKGGTLAWNEAIPPEKMNAMREDAEVFILESPAGVPVSLVLINVIGEVRRRLL